MKLIDLWVFELFGNNLQTLWPYC